MGKSRLLVVGIDYAHTPHPLSGALQDAASVRDLVSETQEMCVLMSEGATAQAIRAGWAWLCGGATPGDTCTFYFSGHGVIVDTSASCAILTADLVCLSAETIRSSLVLPSLRAGVHLVVLLDCCHSGGMCGLATGFQVPNAVGNQGMGCLSSGTAVSMAAATASQRAGDGAREVHYDARSAEWVSTVPHGTFTNALLDVLAGSSQSQTIQAVFSAVCGRMVSEGVQTQTPVLSGSCMGALNNLFPLVATTPNGVIKHSL